MKNIIFIFSLPRSGSTLLQRILMRQRQIHTISEPWLLLPLAYMSKEFQGVNAVYNHRVAQDAIDDLITNLPRRHEDYYNEIARLVFSLYEKMCSEDAIYFLDKTPRYYLIIPFIERLFPNAKFIFLFRNPLSVLASVINTWGHGRLGNLYESHIDLYDGVRRLVEGWEKIQQKSVRISYEMLVMDPQGTMNVLSQYLGLPFDTSELVIEKRKELKGKMGDPTGIYLYNEISNAALNKWKTAFNTKYRVWFAARYLKRIGHDTLKSAGYPLDEMLKSLSEIPDVRNIGVRDLLDYTKMRLFMSLTDDFTKKALRKVLIPGLLTWGLRKRSNLK